MRLEPQPRAPPRSHPAALAEYYLDFRRHFWRAEAGTPLAPIAASLRRRNNAGPAAPPALTLRRLTIRA